MNDIILEQDYKAFLSDIKQRYRSAQLKAAYKVNCEMIQFYWELGKQILEKQLDAKWGTKFLEQLSQDLQKEFPGTQGFSVRNLWFMKQFSQLYPTIVKQAVSQLPWGHIIVLMQQVKDQNARDWYAQNTLKNGSKLAKTLS